MRVMDHLPEILGRDPHLVHAAEAIDLANARLVVGFTQIQKRKRVINAVANGVITLGSAALPIQTYTGPTEGIELAGLQQQRLLPNRQRANSPPRRQRPVRRARRTEIKVGATRHALNFFGRQFCIAALGISRCCSRFCRASIGYN